MTAPNPVLKNASILNSRRIHEGRHHLRPDPVVNALAKYSLAYAAERFDILLYSHCSLSNHQHTTGFDPHGQHPLFRREFHSLMTRSVNCHRGTSEAKWSPNRKSPVILWDVESVLDEIAYSIANPCLHDLVDSPEEWPGFISTIERLAGPPEWVRRPSVFYDQKGDLPELVQLQFVKPPCVADWSDDEYRAEIVRRVDQKCRDARAQRRRERRTVVGRVAVLDADPSDRAMTPLPLGELNPRVACKSVNLRIAILLWLKWFRLEHREARVAFESGEREVVFPFATYWHVLRYGVNCSTTGPPATM
ncbi:MAG: hypothetical protein AAF581_08015 [Planctomycetota bacterium]